jgi:hypothetical protein
MASCQESPTLWPDSDRFRHIPGRHGQPGYSRSSPRQGEPQDLEPASRPESDPGRIHAEPGLRPQHRGHRRVRPGTSIKEQARAIRPDRESRRPLDVRVHRCWRSTSDFCWRHRNRRWAHRAWTDGREKGDGKRETGRYELKGGHRGCPHQRCDPRFSRVDVPVPRSNRKGHHANGSPSPRSVRACPGSDGTNSPVCDAEIGVWEGLCAVSGEASGSRIRLVSRSSGVSWAGLENRCCCCARRSDRRRIARPGRIESAPVNSTPVCFGAEGIPEPTLTVKHWFFSRLSERRAPTG